MGHQAILGVSVVALVLGQGVAPAPTPEARSVLGEPLYAPALAPDDERERSVQLAEARAAYEADPRSADATIWLGRRLAYLGRFRDAVDTFSAGIERHPEDARLYRHRGHRYITLRRFRMRSRISSARAD